MDHHTDPLRIPPAALAADIEAEIATLRRELQALIVLTLLTGGSLLVTIALAVAAL
jgi:hypothetical protein